MSGTRLSVVGLLMLLAYVLPACSSGDDEAASIAFEQSFDGAAQESLFAATGAAVEEDVMCPQATGSFVGNEDDDGNALTEEENAELYGGSERFVAVTVEEMVCDDGSGEFTLRIFTEIDPTDLDHAPETTRWTITGGVGYETTGGEGESSLPNFDDDGIAVWTATGAISTTSADD